MWSRSLGLILLVAGGSASAADTYTLADSFEVPYRVDQRTELTGAVSISKDGKTEKLSLSGVGSVIYDERALPADDADTQKTLRQYRTFDVRRQLGSRNQTAELRPAVRRLVILHSAKGKSPFSPDGPLLWSEIDAVRTDPFLPSMIPALLPAKPVSVNDSWPMAPEAVSELTDIEKVTAGGFTLKLVGIISLNGRQQARISLAGTVRGVDDNGPCKHSLDGTAYFDLTANRLSYLSLKGTHELLDGSGKTVGTIEGRFTLTRSASDARDLADAAIKGVELKPNSENSLLLYDNRELGVRFLYPRRWRVGAVQGRQVTLDGPNGAGILITVETPKTLPTADEFAKEAAAVLGKTAKDVTVRDRPRRVTEKPALDRFVLAGTAPDGAVTVEYAVLTNADGTGATLAARLLDADAKVLVKDFDRLLKALRVEK
jgi:hypothetical protein